MTATATPCAATPGCPGSIDPDGYCDECGVAARPGAAAPGTGTGGSSPATPAPPGGTAAAGRPTGSGAAGASGGPTASGASGAAASGRTVGTGSAGTGSGGSARTAAAGAATSARSVGTGSAGSGRTAVTGSTRSTSRRRFGRGLVAVDPVAVTDPADVVLADPKVPEDKRYCAACGSPVGRSRDGRPGRLTGFCSACGARYSFAAKLDPGDLVGGQYRIAGCLAHGGMGWVYLATDTRVADRWVVLKGLLDTGDVAAAEAAVAERRFLAEVEHANTVKIYNFVEHDGAGYIVMEYVGGRSLKDVLKARRTAAGRPDPLPVTQAAAYLLDILPAFGYLHERGLLYCDFKPDNIIQTADSVKLIDLGAVLRIDDTESSIFGTVGYQAREVATDGPSVESDLYTVGRTLAVLATDFRGYQNTFVTSLPDPIDQPVFADYPSLYGLLCRACHADPGQRFHSAEEMADQLLGVLREALAIDGKPQPGPSTRFTAERASALDGPDRRALPVPLVDTDDPNAAFLASVTIADPTELAALLETAPADSPELGRRAVLALLDGAQPAGRAGTGPGTPAGATADPTAADPTPPGTAATGTATASTATTRGAAAGTARTYAAHTGTTGAGTTGASTTGASTAAASTAGAAARLVALRAAWGQDWQADWLGGLVALAQEQPAAAAEAFERVRAELPGEPAPKLALGMCGELLDRPEDAARWYDLVATTEPACTSAAAGLGRARAAAGDRAGAVSAFGRIPPASAAWSAGQVAAVRALTATAGDSGQPPSTADLVRAADLIGSLTLAPAIAAELRVDLLQQALRAALAGAPLPAAVLGAAAGRGPIGPANGANGTADERRVRFALEHEYRVLARSVDGPDRFRLVDLANEIRPRTLT
ncbi:MAG: serine/threonine-protein kinase PknG [Mycobacteriales bacterium]